MALHLGDAYLRILVRMDDLVKGMTQVKQITQQATTEMGQQWEHFFGTLEGGHAQAAQATEQATESIQTNWLGVAAVYAAVAAAGTMLIKNIATVAMRTQELGIVSEVTARNMGIAKSVVDGQIVALKELGLTTQAASTLTTQFMRSELKLADASKLARAAQNLAIVAMMDSSQAAMTMTRAITMQRPILLRQFGIIGGLNDAYDAMGKVLGILSFRVDSSGKSMRVWARELTTAEKRQSIFNMIMDQSVGLAGAYEAAMDAPGKALRSFSRHIMSAQEAIGKFWLPAMDKAVKVATMFIKAFVNAPEIVHQLAGALLVGVTAVAAMTAAIILKTSSIGAMIGSFFAAQVTIVGFTVTLAAATLGLTLIIAAIVMLGIKLHEHAENMKVARLEAFESSDTYAEYARKMDAAGASAHALSEDIWELAKAEKDAAEAQRILLESADYATYEKAMREAGLGALALAGGIWEAEKAQAALTGTTSKSTDEIENAAKAQEALIEKLKNLKLNYDAVIERNDAMELSMNEVAIARYEEVKQLVLLDKGLREVALAQGLVTQAEIDAAVALETLTKASMEHETRRLEGMKRIQEAEQTAADWMQENIARAIERQKKVQEAYQESLVVITKAIKDMGNVVGEGYAKLAALAEGYQDTVAQLDAEIAVQRVQIAESSARALEQIELAYQTTIRQLRASERTEELAQITQTSGMVLSLLESSYRSQIAAVEAATREELALVKRVNAEQRIAAAKAYQAELADLQKFIGDKLRMWLELHKEELQGLDVYDKMLEAVQKSFAGQLSVADQFTVKYRELMAAMAEGNTDAIDRIIQDIEKLGREIETETGKIVEDIKVMREDMTGAFETGWAEIHMFVADALSSLAGVTQDYQDKVLEAWDSYNASVVSAAFERHKSLREGEINYQRSRQELIARANAEIAAMQAASLAAEGAEQKAKLDEKIVTRQAKLDEELTMLEHNYETQKAWAKWNWDIQQLMQEQAHHLRLAETAEFAMKEAKILQEQAEAKLNSMMAALHAASGFAHKMLLIDGIIVKSAINSAQSQIEAIQAVIAAHKEAAASYEADMEDNLAEVARLGDEIDALIMEGPRLPEIPDFGQWVGDFSTGMAKSGAGMKKSAKETAVSVTKTLKEAIVEIADGFSAAMAIFAEVAEYETPTGLAKGMKLLRQDIEEAVRQMYIAYQALGEEGVKGAGLIAEASGKVFDSIGKAVDTFGKLADYTPPLRSAIDSVLDDVKYVLVKVRTELLDLWGWAGQRKDTVWGHMESWAESVGAIVDIIGQAVLTFVLLEDYTGIMPGAIDLLMADIKLVLDKMIAVIGDGGGLDELKVRWAQFAASLISIVASMIGDMETLAAFEGGLHISQEAIERLIVELAATAQNISYVVGFLDESMKEWGGAGLVIDEFAQNWLEFATGLIGALAQVIADVEVLANFEGGLNVSQNALQALVVTLAVTSQKIVSTVTFIDQFAKAMGGVGLVIDEFTKNWLDFAAGLIGILASVTEDLQTLAAFEGGLTVNVASVANLLGVMEDAVEAILGTVGEIASDFQDDDSVDQLKVAWLEFSTNLISAIAGIINDIKAIGEFEGLDQESFNTSLNQLFDALDWFLTEFNIRATDFGAKVSEATAEIAILMGEIVGSLGKAVEPILSIIEVSVTRVQAETAIGQFFDALEVFLDILDERVDDFADEADQDTADLAAAIGEVVSGIGTAVDPLIKILEFNPEVTNIEAVFTEFFGYLDAVLTKIEEEKVNWEVSDAAIELAAKIDEVTGSLKSAIDFLVGLGEYAMGEGSPVGGFRAFWSDLKIIIGIINSAEEITADAVSTANDFLIDVNDIITDLTLAINNLNSLANLPTEEINLIEAGKNLIRSLVDGFVEQARSEWVRALTALSGIITEILRAIENPVLRLIKSAGRSLGQNFIQGWIDGLNSRAGDLYNTIQRIVNEAINIAKQAAGIASRSQVMFDFGNRMTQGLIDGLQAQQNDVIGALTGMLGIPDVILAQQLAGGQQIAAGLSNNYNVSVTTLEPAPIAREITFALNRQRLQAELNAGRG